MRWQCLKRLEMNPLPVKSDAAAIQSGIKAVIFDFDGVILESSEIKTEAFRELFENRFPAFLDEILEHHRKNMGISRFVKFRYVYENILKQPYTPETEVKLGSEFSKIVYQKVLEAPFVPGAYEFITRNQGIYPMFIASGTPERELGEIVALRNLKPYFAEIHGAPRSKPQIITGIMKGYGYQPQEIAFVGDAESDMRAAKETSVYFIGRIKGGNLNPKDFNPAVEDLTHLGEVLGRLKK